jgi:hypothetical protein
MHEKELPKQNQDFHLYPQKKSPNITVDRIRVNG